MSGRRIYPMGAIITTATGTRYEFCRTRGPWSCYTCGEFSRRPAWRSVTPGGYPRRQSARCDALGCRPRGRVLELGTRAPEGAQPERAEP